MKGRRLLPLLLLTQTASAAQEQAPMDVIFLVTTVLAIAAIIYTYRLTQAKKGLEAKIRELKTIIEKERAEIKENEDKIAQQKKELSEDISPRVEDEVKKAEKLTATKKTSDSLRMEYWSKLGQYSPPSIENKETEKLKAQKKEVESLIEMAKAKYSTGAIDEKTFGEIMGEYQKKLLELESKMPPG